MDAYVFRLVALELAVFMRGGRVEKIYSPAPGLLALTVYNLGFKRVIIARHDKNFNQGLGRSVPLSTAKEPPSLCWSAQKLPNPEKPSTQVMTLRKYLAGRRLGSAHIDWLNRRMFFHMPPMPGPAQTPKGAPVPLWFCLDLHNGPHLTAELPDMPQPAWPDAAMLGKDHRVTLQDESFWRAFPALTPGLRRALLGLEAEEAAALLADLAYECEKGTGALYIYSLNGAPHLLSAWQLPQNARNGMAEAEITPTLSLPQNTGIQLEPDNFPAMEAARAVYEPKILSFLGLSLQKERLSEEKSSARRLTNTLKKLDEEELRLRKLQALREQAVLIQGQLWRFGADAKLPELRISAQEHPEGQEALLRLDPLKTLRENMAHMFKQSERGARGLEFVAKRRKELQAELALLEGGLMPSVRAQTAPAAMVKSASANPGAKKRQDASGPARQVQSFTSTDGFTLLRGKSATGNHTLLKLAQPHDLWLHVQGGPSAHVIIRRPHLGVEIPPATLREAGLLSAIKSWRRHDDKAEIITALVKDVKPVKGGAAGSVLVEKQQESLVVKVEADIDERLSGGR